jgi:hypothetical protein
MKRTLITTPSQNCHFFMREFYQRAVTGIATTLAMGALRKSREPGRHGRRERRKADADRPDTGRPNSGEKS